MKDYIEFPLVMAMHVLSDMKERVNYYQDHVLKSDDMSKNPYWMFLERFCGTEHAQWIMEHDFLKEYSKHNF